MSETGIEQAQQATDEAIAALSDIRAGLLDIFKNGVDQGGDIVSFADLRLMATEMFEAFIFLSLEVQRVGKDEISVNAEEVIESILSQPKGDTLHVNIIFSDEDKFQMLFKRLDTNNDLIQISNIKLGV